MAGEFHIGHEHCGVCGSCFLFPAQLHRCPAVIDPEVLEVFIAETKREFGKSVRLKGASPEGMYQGPDSNASKAQAQRD